MNVFRTLALASALTASAVLQAGDPMPFRYTLDYSNAGGTVTATGFIELDRNIVTTPGDYVWILPDPAVIDFEITVSGSSSGDGTYTIDDYEAIIFDTNGGALDLDMELVGQPTDGNPWGSTIPRGDGFDSGDFNIFIPGMNASSYGAPADTQGVGGAPPTGTFFFEITADGGAGESMLLTSFRPAGPLQPRIVPTLSVAGLVLLLMTLGAVGVLVLRRRATH